MNTHHTRFTPFVLALLAALAASLVWQSASAQVSRPISSLIVPIVGTAQAGAQPVAFSGRARIMSTFVTDPDFRGPPSVILAIDLLNVSGVGQTTGARYIARGEEKLIRLFGDSDLIEVAFPIFRFPAGPTATTLANPLLASFKLDFDGDDGQLRQAIAGFSTPNLPAPRPGQ